MLQQLTDAEKKVWTDKFIGVLAGIGEEIAAVKSRYADTPGPHLSEADWWWVSECASSYAWSYLRKRGVDAPALVPGTVVEIALSKFALEAPNDTKAAKARFNKLHGAKKDLITEAVMEMAGLDERTKAAHRSAADLMGLINQFSFDAFNFVCDAVENNPYLTAEQMWSMAESFEASHGTLGQPVN